MGGRLFESETPHFFKIILSDNIQNGRLGIPKKFLRKYGSNLSNWVFLRLANGDAWEVELLRKEDGVWLQRNWPDFVKHYSIERGHFLVFRYEGDSVFRVVIFDKSASEIEYPVVSENGGDSKQLLPPKVEAENEGDVVLVEERFEDLPLSSLLKKKKKKKKKTSSQASDDEHVNEEAIDGVGGSSGFSSICRGSSQVKKRGRSKEEELGANGSTSCAKNSCIESGFWRRVQPLTSGDAGRQVLERAASFQSTNPFFLVLMKPSFLQPLCTLNLPGRFFLTYIRNVNRNLDVDFYDSNGGMWPAQYYFGMYNGMPQVRICQGWKAFVRDNLLRVGDVCAFELVRIDKVSFRIVIFRAAIDASPCLSCSGRVTDEDEDAVRTLLGNRLRGTGGDVSRKRKQKEPATVQKQIPQKAEPVKGTPPKKRNAMTQGESSLKSDAEKDELAIRQVMSTLNEIEVQVRELANFMIKIEKMIQSLSCFNPTTLP